MRTVVAVLVGLILGCGTGAGVVTTCRECERFAQEGPTTLDWQPDDDMGPGDVEDIREAVEAWQNSTKDCASFRRVDGPSKLTFHAAPDLAHFPDRKAHGLTGDYDPHIIGWYFSDTKEIWYIPSSEPTGPARQALLVHEIGHWLGLKFGDSIHSPYAENTCMSDILQPTCLPFGRVPTYDLRAFYKLHPKCPGAVDYKGGR